MEILLGIIAIVVSAIALYISLRNDFSAVSNL